MALRHKSRAAYRYMKESGVFTLPSEATLNDYAWNVGSGIDVEGISDISKRYPSEDVAILCDEMKIKDGLYIR